MCAPPDPPCASHAESCRARRARTRTRPGGATHVLRDGDEADADEREGAAGVVAGPGVGRQSDPSRGSEARHAHAHATLASSTAHAHTQAHSSRKRRKHRDMHVTRTMHDMLLLAGRKTKGDSDFKAVREIKRERK